MACNIETYFYQTFQMELRDYSGADSESSGSGTNQALFSEKVQESQKAIQRGDFQSAIVHYSEALELDPVSEAFY